MHLNITIIFGEPDNLKLLKNAFNEFTIHPSDDLHLIDLH